MLSHSDITHYQKNGYITPEFKLSDRTISAIKKCHQQLLTKHPEFDNYCPALLAYDKSFLEFAKDPDILDMVGQLIGPDFALWNSSFFAKPANGGHATPWHQDGEYWPITPLATCTVWIAIDKATTENGCLRVIPESHRNQTLLQHHTNSSKEVTLNQELDNNTYDESIAQNIELEAGQISLHDVYLVHGSKANHSNHPRRGMTLRFMPTTSVYSRELAIEKSKSKNLIDQSQRTLYLMRGKDVSGKNDFTQLN